MKYIIATGSARYDIYYKTKETPFDLMIDKLETDVKKLMLEGYKPQGGVSITKEEPYIYAAQAMIKEEELKKPTKCKVGYCQNNGSQDSYVVETKYHCPTCGAVVSEYTDFCEFCRQPLDWGENEEK